MNHVAILVSDFTRSRMSWDLKKAGGTYSYPPVNEYNNEKHVHFYDIGIKEENTSSSTGEAPPKLKTPVLLYSSDSRF